MDHVDLSDIVFDTNYLEIKKLKDITACEDLGEVERFESSEINTSKNRLADACCHLTSVKYLKLSGSYVPVLRDLGVVLHTVKILWLSSCSLKRLEGASGLVNLTELYLQFNYIDDISDLAYVDKLSVLDLEGNNLMSLSDVQYLTTCLNLEDLILTNNPLSIGKEYSEGVMSLLPQLKNLDYCPLDRVQSLNLFNADADSFSAYEFPQVTIPLKIIEDIEEVLADDLDGFNYDVLTDSKHLTEHDIDMLIVNIAAKTSSSRKSPSPRDCSTLTQHTHAVFCGKPTRSIKCIKVEQQQVAFTNSDTPAASLLSCFKKQSFIKRFGKFSKSRSHQRIKRSRSLWLV